MYEFSYSVGLIGSSRSMQLHLRGETTVRQNSSNLHIRKFKWHSCINECVFISLLHLLTLSGRFRVGFGVGDISNTIEH